MNEVKFNMDMAPVTEYMQFLKDFSLEIDATSTREVMADSIGRSTRAAFGEYADLMATQNPLNLWHVYEAGMIGNPEGRLWTTMLTGRGATKELVFDWRAARKPNLVGEENTGIPGDTRKSVHVFVWKAPIIEEGATMTIAPSSAKKALAFPKSDNSGMSFSRNAIQYTTPRQNMGAFSTIWEEFWRTATEAIILEDFVRPTEKILDRELPAVTMQLSKSTAKPMTFSVSTKPHRDMSAIARKIKIELLSGYVRAAHQREAFFRV